MSLFSCPTVEAQTNRIVLTDPCFISDLHLNAESGAQAAFFVRFLNEVASAYKELVILGDFFDYWVGDDAWDSSIAILEPLKSWASNHKLFLMHGNRDFMMGKHLSERLGATLLADPTVATLGSQRLLLSHGDLWCVNDHDYQEVRRKVRSVWWQWLVLRLPLSKRLEIANNARARSKQSKENKEVQLMDVDDKTISEWAQKLHCDYVIHGHTHRPGRYRINDSLQRFVLADWRFSTSNTFKGGFLTFENNVPVLQNFH